MDAKQDQPDTQPPAAQRAAGGRRRFLKAGVAAAPVLLTLHSKPVLGNVCHSPSASTSGNVSQQAERIETCGGYPCSYWRSTGAQGGSGWLGVQPSTAFHPTYRPGLAAESRQYLISGLQSRPYTMLELLNGASPNNRTGICSHFIAAQLNINCGLVPRSVMDITRLNQIWIEWSRSGYYRPSASARPWDAAAIVQFLKASGIAP